jgi:hypothetical protein|tara:strand:- start:76 stop:678 length:603 start_codon:yes stop_codon:yes gene_type:complete
MNKFIILVFLIFSTILFADQELYQKVTGYHFNDVWKSMSDFNLDLRYDIDEDKVYIYIPEFIYTVAYELDKEDRQKFISVLEKYFEWQQKAIEMEVKLEKNIDDVELKGYFKLNDDWQSSCYKSCLIRFSFLSQNTTRHQLVFSFGKINACYNEYSDHKPDQVYMEYDDAVILKDALTEEKLQTVIIEVEKKKSIEDAFK